MERTSGNRNIDTLMTFIFFALVLAGLLNIYSVEQSAGHEHIFELTSSFTRQLIFIGVSAFLFFLVMIIDVRFFINFSYPIYAATILLLALTLVVGKEIAGSKSWIGIGVFSIQPSEFAKFGTALALARFIDTTDILITKKRHAFIGFMIIGLPMILVLLQRDYGSALVFVAFILVLYRQGLSGWFIYLPIAAAVIFLLALLINTYVLIGVFALLGAGFVYFANSRKQAITFAIIGFLFLSSFTFSVDYVFNHVLLPHQQSRINVLLGKEIDLKGAGYNVHQSLIAIGSGGFHGKGFLNGTQTKFNFVPEQNTDFIFCTIAEEYGFLGSTLLVILFAGLLIHILLLSERQKLRYTRIYGYGIISIIFVHFMINLGMTLGLLPVIGIPLPLISYGGSSLIAFSLMIAVFLKLEVEFRHYFN